MSPRPAARVLAVWCPDWPAVAAAAGAGLPAEQPVAVLHANRVVTCSATAREAGVRRGMRKREAQSRCPELHIAQPDPDRDARLFEPVAAAVDSLASGIEILRPGLLVLPARGVIRYFGSAEAAVRQLLATLATAGVEARIGIADELPTAIVAARHSTLVPPGRDAQFLAPLPITELAAESGPAEKERAALLDLLHRLGLRRIGDFAALTTAQVTSRFGADAIVAHRLARALPDRPPAARSLPPEVAVRLPCEPPIDRVDAAAFTGRLLATRLTANLSAASLACTRLEIRAETEAGEELSRVWRCAEPLTADGVADRVRWQLDGWLTRPPGDCPTAAITGLHLIPVEVAPAAALQLGLWGDTGSGDERAMRALVRVQGLLGGDAVRVGVLSGGRGPAERVTMVTFGDEPAPDTDPAPPWPGRMPEPAPAVLMLDRPRVALEAADGTPVRITARGLFSGPPARLRWGRASWRLTAWAGPWLLDELWWAPGTSPAARAQVELPGPHSLLLLARDDRWCVEGLYD
ncbi:DNA polymerase Y family protein [Nocardia carnea]|uniref:DNA polymerase Y family protein n=1 Tax=Nocardia carnea TaxID=37328 RepID=UPI002458B9AB|nr:DNA polymerase Y family protein [Nocardia carnea]